jgi:hypothetical protein
MGSEINLESLKGTYDRYSEEWATWSYLIDIVEETAEEFGFKGDRSSEYRETGALDSKRGGLRN